MYSSGNRTRSVRPGGKYRSIQHTKISEIQTGIFGQMERALIVLIIRCVFFFLSIGRESTSWPANNFLQIMVCSCVVPSKRVFLRRIFCSSVIGTTFSREKWQIASLSCQEVIEIWKQSWWSNDKTIIELGYHKISWFASVSQINYLPKPKAEANNWSTRHWQITIFCLTSSNTRVCSRLPFICWLGQLYY